MERLINIFGKGFVGSRYCELTTHTKIVNTREDYVVAPQVTDIVYFISTVDNYNVHTDMHIDINTNLNVLMDVLKSFRENSPDAVFNFISSWFVYGNVPLPAKEDSYCDPRGFYSITKRAAEQMLISYCETFGLKYRIMRLGNVLGSTDNKVSKKKNALQYMINQIREGRDIDLYDNGTFYRDYSHVDDVVQSINLVIEKGAVNDIYNIGSGEPTYIKDAMEYAVKACASVSNLNSIPPAEFHGVVQTKNMVLDISKIKSLGYVPKYSFYDIVDSLLYK